MIRFLVAGVLSLTCGLVPLAALAGAPEAALTRAVAAKEVALDYPEPGNWQVAFERFLEADAVESSPDTKYELGFAASQLRQDDLAVSYYEQACDAGLTGPGRSKAEAFLAQQRPLMARLLVKGLPGMRVRVRGIERGTLPLAAPIILLAGETQLELVEASGMVEHRMIGLLAGKVSVLDLNQTHTAGQALQQTLPAASRDTPVAWSPRVQFVPTDDLRQPEGDYSKWFLGLGLGLALGSALILPVSYAKLGSKRRELSDACEVASSTINGCAAAKPGRYETALELAADIARWRTLRAVSWTALGVGAASAGFGLARVISANSKEGTAVLTFNSSMSSRGFVLELMSQF